MSDFKKWWTTGTVRADIDRKDMARAAYQAGQESVIEAATATAKAYDGAEARVKELEEALQEMTEEDKERVASAFYSDATQEVIDALTSQEA